MAENSNKGHKTEEEALDEIRRFMKLHRIAHNMIYATLVLGAAAFGVWTQKHASTYELVAFTFVAMSVEMKLLETFIGNKVFELKCALAERWLDAEE